MVKPHMKGYCELVVYADDFVVSFQHKRDAERFYELLKRRTGRFGLRLEEEKSRLLEFGRFAQVNAQKRGKKAETFDFLGFTHYCSKSRSGKFRVKRKTSRKKMRKKIKEINALLKSIRHHKVVEIIVKLNQILPGYFRYYGITDNFQSINNFREHVRKCLFYWLNRRGQRKSYTWEGFTELLKVYPLEKAKIHVNVYAR